MPPKPPPLCDAVAAVRRRRGEGVGGGVQVQQPKQLAKTVIRARSPLASRACCRHTRVRAAPARAVHCARTCGGGAIAAAAASGATSHKVQLAGSQGRFNFLFGPPLAPQNKDASRVGRMPRTSAFGNGFDSKQILKIGEASFKDGCRLRVAHSKIK